MLCLAFNQAWWLHQIEWLMSMPSIQDKSNFQISNPSVSWGQLALLFNGAKWMIQLNWFFSAVSERVRFNYFVFQWCFTLLMAAMFVSKVDEASIICFHIIHFLCLQITLTYPLPPVHNQNMKIINQITWIMIADAHNIMSKLKKVCFHKTWHPQVNFIQHKLFTFWKMLIQEYAYNSSSILYQRDIWLWRF